MYTIIETPVFQRLDRWARAGMGKRGGARIIYFNQLTDGVIALLMIYTKAKFDNLSTEFLVQLRKEFEDV